MENKRISDPCVNLFGKNTKLSKMATIRFIYLDFRKYTVSRMMMKCLMFKNIVFTFSHSHFFFNCIAARKN